MKRNKLMLNNEWEDVFAGLPDASAGKLIKAVFAAHAGKATLLDDPVLSAVFAMMKTVILSNREAYEEKCRKMAENGAQGGRPKSESLEEKPNETKSFLEKANESKTKQKKPIEKKGIEINKDIEKENIKEKEHKYGEYKHVRLTDKQYADLLEKYGEKLLAAGIKRVDEYCEETGKRYKNYALVIQRWGVRASPPTKREDYFTAGRHDDDGTAEAKAKVIEMAARGLL